MWCKEQHSRARQSTAVALPPCALFERVHHEEATCPVLRTLNSLWKGPRGQALRPPAAADYIRPSRVSRKTQVAPYFQPDLQVYPRPPPPSTCIFLRLSELPPPTESTSQSLIHRCFEIINVYHCLKPHNFGVICYAVTEKEELQCVKVCFNVEHAPYLKKKNIFFFMI